MLFSSFIVVESLIMTGEDGYLRKLLLDWDRAGGITLRVWMFSFGRIFLSCFGGIVGVVG
jgi:hypothetical protein